LRIAVCNKIIGRIKAAKKGNKIDDEGIEIERFIQHASDKDYVSKERKFVELFVGSNRDAIASRTTDDLLHNHLNWELVSLGFKGQI
jgi:hypothetical protein